MDSMEGDVLEEDIVRLVLSGDEKEQESEMKKKHICNFIRT